MQDFEPGFMDQFWGLNPNPAAADYELLQYSFPQKPGEGPQQP